MKKVLLPLFFATAILACNSPKEKQISQTSSNVTSNSDFITGKSTIPKDSANKMIMSYLNSISTTTANDSNLRSLTIDIDTLRTYLNDTGLYKVKHLKLMFAHTLDYINKGGQNKYAGMNEKALTLVIVGYDEAGNYVFYNTNYVFDNCKPCPYNCPTVGSAAVDTL